MRYAQCRPLSAQMAPPEAGQVPGVKTVANSQLELGQNQDVKPTTWRPAPNVAVNNT